MYLFKKLYFMVLSDRGRDTERPFSFAFFSFIFILADNQKYLMKIFTI